MPSFAQTPEPPYYAVIFSSRRRDGEDEDGYADMAARMLDLASRQPGFLGAESAREADGFGITVSYWKTREAIADWKQHVEHLAAQRLGRERWYTHYALRVAQVERAHDGPG